MDRQKAGTGTRIDTTRADVQLARQRQAQLVAENQRDVDNLTSTAAPAGPSPALPTVEAALATAREARPEMRTLKEQLRAAELAERQPGRKNCRASR